MIELIFLVVYGLSVIAQLICFYIIFKRLDVLEKDKDSNFRFLSRLIADCNTQEIINQHREAYEQQGKK